MYQWKNNNWIAALFFFLRQTIYRFHGLHGFFFSLYAIPGKFKVWTNMHMQLILIT